MAVNDHNSQQVNEDTLYFIITVAFLSVHNCNMFASATFTFRAPRIKIGEPVGQSILVFLVLFKRFVLQEGKIRSVDPKLMNQVIKV